MLGGIGGILLNKTLYISDLDGTLLNREGNLSEYTASVILRMIGQGQLFTIATARSQQAAQEIMDQLGLQLPAVLTNGATIYHPVERRYLQVNSIPPPVLPQMVEIMDRHKVCIFLYTLRDNLLSVYYQQFRNDWDKVYHAHRVEKYSGRIYQCSDLTQAVGDSIPVYMVAYGPMDFLQKVQLDLNRIPKLSSELYSDVYNNNYFMDIFPATASKANGMLALQQYAGADSLVAFGDNFNDLSMLLAADRAYVPKNGVDSAKNLATAVLDYHHRDGVARFLSAEMGWED